jgi:hypothetical protein
MNPSRGRHRPAGWARPGLWLDRCLRAAFYYSAKRLDRCRLFKPLRAAPYPASLAALREVR